MDCSLHRENLVPFYLIEDRLKENFSKIERFMAAQQLANNANGDQIAVLNQYNEGFKEEVGRRLAEMEKKIVREIGNELEGRIIVAINKNMASFSEMMEAKGREIAAVSHGIGEKMENMRKQIINQTARDGQKAIGKEIQKLEKKNKASFDELSRKINAGSKMTQAGQAGSQVVQAREVVREVAREEQGSPQSFFSEQWVLKIKQLQAKSGRFQQFLVGFDKRFYQNMSALKQSWKQLGEQVLQTKKRLTLKQDQLKLQLIKLRGIRQFQGAPEDFEQTFKSTLLKKFTDIYQLLGQLVTRTDLEGESDRTRKVLARHDGELSDVREEMGRNNDYFTFYANNSDSDDLAAQIKALREEVKQGEAKVVERVQRAEEKHREMEKGIGEVGRGVEELGARNGKVEADFTKLRADLFQEMERIDALQEHSNFTPQKLVKIHNTLDIDFSPSEQELLGKKQIDQGTSMALKQLRGEISKLKDELFVLGHQTAELQKLKKLLGGLQGRVEKLKFESEQAMVSRKPWVCLSCDKNEKEKEGLRRDSTRKKLVDNKGLFGKDKSDKMIKLIPTAEEKFQVYEKYREKYLSDSIKLPEIYKEKIGDKELVL